jgi:hypothetical protein
MKLKDVNSQPTLVSRSFYNLWKMPPYDFSLDLYVYVLANKRNIKIRRFQSEQRKRVSGNSSWNAGFFSRIKMIVTVINYSLKVKKNLKDE